MSYKLTVGGKLIVNAKGDIKSYAKENIEINSEKTIKISGVEKGVTSGKPEMVAIYVNEKCLVHFRPKNNWNGENYGFDWVRTGDTTIKGDTNYKKIIGKYGSLYASRGGVLTQSNDEFRKLMSKFNPHTFFVKDKSGKKKAVNYCVPWLCIYPENIVKQIKQKDGTLKPTEVKSGFKNTTAILKTVVAIDKKPEKLELDYDTKLFKIVNAAFPLSVGRHEIEITITCLKEFSSDKPIKVVATYKDAKGKLEKSLAGKINVIRNKERYKINVLFVNVWTNINNAKKPNKANTIGRDIELEKYLNQGLVNPLFETVTLKLDTDIDPVTKKITNRKTNFNTISNSIGGINPNIPDGSIGDIYKFLNTELYKTYSFKKYQDYFKVYFIKEDANGLYGIGRSIKKADDFRTILVYKIGFADSTVAHETLHSMGLYHTFDNNSDFTFEIFKTDNIMDYSDTATPPLPVISLYHWQWSKLWDRAIKDL
ncbi:MAG: hypothetical protein ABI892_17090 [Flavobacterium sp.]